MTYTDKQSIINKMLKPFNVGMRKIFPRSAIKFIRDNTKGELVGAEVGVLTGENAESMIKELNLKKLYLIDPYKVYEDYQDKSQFSQEQLDNYKAGVKEIADQLDFVEFIEEDSISALHNITEKLDFVYLDANHKYEYIINDIRNYWNLLKEGGILAGHDFTNGQEDVIQAVLDFTRENNLTFNTENSDWWIIKPTGSQAFTK